MTKQFCVRGHDTFVVGRVQRMCRECRRARRRSYAKDPEKERARSARWKANNPKKKRRYDMVYESTTRYSRKVGKALAAWEVTNGSL